MTGSTKTTFPAIRINSWKSKWKWMVGVPAVLILLVVLTFYIVLSFYDFNKIKPAVTRVVREATGRELIIGGGIELDVGLIPRLVLEEVRFRNAPWGSGPDLAGVKRLEVRLALLPLVGGKIRIRRLVAIEPHILVETNASGRSNLEFGPVPKTRKPRSFRDRNRLPLILFREIYIENGRLTYNDGLSGRSYEVELNHFAAGSDRDTDGLKLKLTGSYRGLPFEMEGTVGFMAAMVDPQKDWPLKLSLRVAGTMITLDGTVKDVFNGKGIHLNVTAGGPSVPELAELADITGLPDLGPFKVCCEVVDPEGSLAFPHLHIQLGSDDLVKLEVEGSIEHPTAPGGMDLGFEILGTELTRLGKLAGKTLPIRGPFKVSGRAKTISAERVELYDLRTCLGESVLEGSVTIDLSGQRPFIHVDQYSEKLDLRPMLSEKSKVRADPEGQAGQGREREKVFSPDPMPMETLNRIDAHIKVNLKDFISPSWAFEDVSTDIVLENGNLVVGPFSARMGGGFLDSRFHLGAAGKPPTVSLALKVTRFDLGRMIKKLQHEDILAGKLDLEAELEGKGRTAASIMASLNGKLILAMDNTKISNACLKTLGADTGSGIFRWFGSSEVETEYTLIDCCVGLFIIKDGIAAISPLVMGTPAMVISGHGEIDLGTEALDLVLKPSPKKGLAGFSISLTELARPFKVGGTLARPCIGVDPAGFTLTIGKAVGGVVLFGPAGLLVTLAGSSSGDENPCLEVFNAAKKEYDSQGKNPEKGKGIVQKSMDGIGDAFRKMFGGP